MNETKGGTSKRRKVLSATLAVIMAFVMLLSGTLAYFYQTHAVNQIKGTAEDQAKKVIAHDDFTEEKMTSDGSTIHNKDVYLENVGSVPVYVRVKLVEKLTYNGSVISDTVHKPASAENLSVGTAEKDSAAAGDIHSYFTLQFGNQGDTSRNTFLSGNAEIYTDDTLDTENKYAINAQVAQDTSRKQYNAATETNQDMKDNIKTLRYAPVITMTEFLADSKTDEWRQNYEGWVIDNSPVKNVEGKDYAAGDGWIYYSKMLNPGQSTPVLLNGVVVDGKLYNQEYTYDIDVKFESVDRTDLGIWNKAQETAEGEEWADKTVTADQVLSYGATKIIEWADVGGYTGANLKTAAIIAKNKEAATSTVAKKLYDEAINQLNSYVKSDSEYADYLAKMYAEMADETEKMYKDPAQQAYITGAVLKIDPATGEVTDEGSIRKADIQPGVAKKIMATADLNGDNKLTGEEALGLTNLILHGDTSITKLDGVNLQNFKHLRRLQVSYCDLQEFNASNFVRTENGETNSLIALSLFDNYRFYSEKTEDADKVLDLESLSSTLRELTLNFLYGISEIKGLENFSNLHKFELFGVLDSKGGRYTIEKSTLNTLFSDAKSGRTLRILSLGRIRLAENGTINDLTALPSDFVLPTGLNSLTLCIDNFNSEAASYTIPAMKNLTALSISNYNTSGTITCTVNKEGCPALQKVTYYSGGGRVVFSELPNDITPRRN